MKRAGFLDRRGSESVEVAVALPLIVVLLFVGLECGWMLLRSIQLDHAARVGAREASLHAATATAVETRIAAALDGTGIASASVQIDPADPELAAPGDVITVRVSVDYSDVHLLGLSAIMPLPQSLEGRASMVREPE